MDNNKYTATEVFEGSAHKNNLNFDFDMSEQHLYKYVFSILEKNK